MAKKKLVKNPVEETSEVDIRVETPEEILEPALEPVEETVKSKEEVLEVAGKYTLLKNGKTLLVKNERNQVIAKGGNEVNKFFSEIKRFK